MDSELLAGDLPELQAAVPIDEVTPEITHKMHACMHPFLVNLLISEFCLFL
jgi:hypothetical protein